MVVNICEARHVYSKSDSQVFEESFSDVIKRTYGKERRVGRHTVTAYFRLQHRLGYVLRLTIVDSRVEWWHCYKQRAKKCSLRLHYSLDVRQSQLKMRPHRLTTFKVLTIISIIR